jgi:hypothetical protein
MGTRTASAQFQELWDTLDAERVRRKMSRKALAKHGGFRRSSYFEYAKHGHIPFNSLERVAACLKATFSATVQTEGSDVHDSADVGTEDSAMIDYIAPLLDVLREFPEDHRQTVAGVMIGAAVRAVRELPPFGGSAAGQSSAGRGRKR